MARFSPQDLADHLKDGLLSSRPPLSKMTSK